MINQPETRSPIVPASRQVAALYEAVNTRVPECLADRDQPEKKKEREKKA
jgi:hypothetical protein